MLVIKAKISSLLKENLTKIDKKEVKSILKKEIDEDFIEKMIAKILKEKIKNDKDLEDRIVDITKNVLVQFHKFLWLKRGTWKTYMKNKEA